MPLISQTNDNYIAAVKYNKDTKTINWAPWKWNLTGAFKEYLDLAPPTFQELANLIGMLI